MEASDGLLDRRSLVMIEYRDAISYVVQEYVHITPSSKVPVKQVPAAADITYAR